MTPTRHRLPAAALVSVLVAVAMAGCLGPDGPAGNDASTNGTDGTNGANGVDPASGPYAWSSLPDAPTPRTEVSAVILQGELYVIGGFADNNLVSPAVEALNVTTNTWRTVAPLPVALHHAPAVVHDGAIHVLGGYVGIPFVPTVFHFVYDPDVGVWTNGSPLPEPRGAHGIGLVGDQAHLVGGVGTNGLLATVDVIDLTTGTWSSAAELPTPRDHLAVAALDGHVFAIGGREMSLSTNTGLNEVLDVDADAWSERAPMPTPRGGIGAGILDGLVVVVGGEGPDGTFDEAEAYAPSTGAWTAMPPMPTARHGLGVVGHNGTLYTTAGGEEPGLFVSGATEALSGTAAEAQDAGA